MDIKDILKKYWFVLVVAVLSLVFVVAFSIDTVKSKPYEVKPLTKDGKDVVLSINDKDYYYADDLYADLYEQYGLSTAFRSFYKTVIRESVETTADMTNYAQNYVSYMQYNNDTAQIESFLKQNGYSSIDDLGTYCIDMLKQDVIVGDYLKANFDKYVAPTIETNKPRLISHILVKVADVAEVENEDGTTSHVANPSAEESERLNKILEALAAGKDFADVAAEFSDDSSSQVGGLLGIVSEASKSRYVAEFAEESMKLNPGETSEVITTQYGYHILKAEAVENEQLLEDANFISEVNELFPAVTLKAIMEKADEMGFEIVDSTLKEQIELSIAEAE